MRAQMSLLVVQTKTNNSHTAPPKQAFCPLGVFRLEHNGNKKDNICQLAFDHAPSTLGSASSPYFREVIALTLAPQMYTYECTNKKLA